ncbi:flagellar basal body P-ring formation chaperone FlgA [Aestuariispira insulae]|uniref:Flagella basal body P-ring formation protein FlgA n=1 Tax=Aestuariispira insulae TaxID=1461337 RepID=A0A3D9HSI8_9PROT|nr:flagellar basal body P-ring formation chaperone FlgA [Aestuariispira insulae]RED52457.1 flagella basal body P-ring formation protein FlgA [Aestuariispira insulae]
MRNHITRHFSRLLSGLTIAFTIGLTGPAAATDKDTISAPVMLRSQVSVDNDQIRLGDVFLNVDKYAERTIARAPGPGKSITLKASWLWRVANFYSLDWRPTSKLDTATVTRSSIEIDSEQMVSQIRAEIEDKYRGEGPFEIDLDRNLLSIQLPTNVEPGIRVRNLNIDQRSGRFSATVVAPAQGNILASIPLSGSIYEIIEVAVPARRLMRNEIITARDLQVIRVRKSDILRHAVTDADHLIGMAAKRVLISGNAVTLDDIQEPILVQRNTRVTVELQTDFMQLTAQGKAMQSGARGEIIQVRNLTSGKTIEAVVTGANLVTVAMPTQSAMR